MKSLSRIVSVIALFLCAFVVNPAQAEPQLPGSLDGERVAIELVRWSTEVDGKKSRTGTASTLLRVGQRGNVYASSGFSAPGTPAHNALCSNAIGTGGQAGRLADEAAHLWWVEVRLVGATTELIDLELDWSRYDNGSRQPPTRSAKRRIRLQEGDAHVIDFLESEEPEMEENCPLNVLFELQATIVEDPRLARNKIRYDVWVVDRDRDGAQELLASVEAEQGQRVEPRLGDTRWSLAGGASTDRSVAEVIAVFEASLRGRVRTDGSVDLHLTAHRALGVVPLGQPRSGGVGGGGSRLVNVRSGETVELVLPTPGGGHTQTIPGVSDADSPRDGVEIDGDRVRVDFEPFFRDHRVSLIVSATIVGGKRG